MVYLFKCAGHNQLSPRSALRFAKDPEGRRKVNRSKDSAGHYSGGNQAPSKPTRSTARGTESGGEEPPSESKEAKELD